MWPQVVLVDPDLDPITPGAEVGGIGQRLQRQSPGIGRLTGTLKHETGLERQAGTRLCRYRRDARSTAAADQQPVAKAQASRRAPSS